MTLSDGWLDQTCEPGDLRELHAEKFLKLHFSFLHTTASDIFYCFLLLHLKKKKVVLRIHRCTPACNWKSGLVDLRDHLAACALVTGRDCGVRLDHTTWMSELGLHLQLSGVGP